MSRGGFPVAEGNALAADNLGKLFRQLIEEDGEDHKLRERSDRPSLVPAPECGWKKAGDRSAGGIVREMRRSMSTSNTRENTASTLPKRSTSESEALIVSSVRFVKLQLAVTGKTTQNTNEVCSTVLRLPSTSSSSSCDEDAVRDVDAEDVEVSHLRIINATAKKKKGEPRGEYINADNVDCWAFKVQPQFPVLPVRSGKLSLSSSTSYRVARARPISKEITLQETATSAIPCPTASDKGNVSV